MCGNNTISVRSAIPIVPLTEKTCSVVQNPKAPDNVVKAELVKAEMIVEPRTLFRKANESSSEVNDKSADIPKVFKTAQTSRSVVSAITEHVSDKL